MKTKVINQTTKRAIRSISFMILIVLFALVSCDRSDSHIVLPESQEQSKGGAIVGFNTDGVKNAKFDDTHLYGFDVAQKMIMHRYYPTQHDLSKDLFEMESGAYTFIAVLNVGEEFAKDLSSKANLPLSDVTLSYFMSYIKQIEPNYPDMLTGMITRSINNNLIERIEIPLFDKSNGITATATSVVSTIILPDAGFIDYQKLRTKATAPHNLRGVMEISKKGTTDIVQRLSSILTPTKTEGTYTMTTQIPNGDYDINLWVDYTENGSTTDLHYDSKNLEMIKIISIDRTYSAGSDAREVFYGASSFTADGAIANVYITTQRPQAKYVLIADDVKRYKNLLAANPDKYVPLDQLSVTVVYEGYLPDGFNVKTGKPNSSQTGYKYQSALPTVCVTDTEVKVGSDHVFVNGSESFVTLTVLVTDKSGRVLSRVQGVQVDYKRNMLTTVRGDFLTAGIVNPGVNIDTNWEGVFDVLF